MLQKIRKQIIGASSAGCVALLLLGVAPVFSKAKPTPQEGTSVEELSVLQSRPLPLPNETKVAILPFTDSTGSIGNLRMGTVANYLIWEREGFRVMPLTDSFQALKEDKEVEPGLPLRRGDAQRLGKKLNADWVVYGDIRELSHYRKVTAFKNSKYLIAGVRIAVVDVKSGETLYWHSRVDKTGGKASSGRSSATTLRRRGAIIVSANAIQPFFHVLPPHVVGQKDIDSGDVASMVETLWPGDKNND